MKLKIIENKEDYYYEQTLHRFCIELLNQNLYIIEIRIGKYAKFF